MCGRELGALKLGVGAGPEGSVFGQRPRNTAVMEKTHPQEEGHHSPRGRQQGGPRVHVRGTGAKRREECAWGLQGLMQRIWVFFHRPRSSRERKPRNAAASG